MTKSIDNKSKRRYAIDHEKRVSEEDHAVFVSVVELAPSCRFQRQKTSEVLIIYACCMAWQWHHVSSDSEVVVSSHIHLTKALEFWLADFFIEIFQIHASFAGFSLGFLYVLKLFHNTRTFSFTKIKKQSKKHLF
jgi:hypothetical protein